MKLKKLLAVLLCTIGAAAQPADSLANRRNETLAEARALKSIFKTDAAIEKLSELVEPGSFDEEVLSELADCHFQNGDYETALGSYQMLALRSPGNLLYKIKLMQLYFRLKAYQQSAAAGCDVLSRDSIPAVAALTGDAFNLAGQADSALLYYRYALEKKPRNEAVVSKAANILLAKKDYDQVISMTKGFLELDPENMTVNPILGLAYYLKGDYEPACETFEKQASLGDDSYSTHFYLGQSYWHTNTTYRAEEELLKAWAIDSSDANLAWTIAAVKSDARTRNFTREIRPWLDKATALLQPDSSLVSKIHQQYASGYYRINDFKQAIAHYETAYRNNPSFISALSTIGYCYEQLKQYKKALEWYEKYLAVAKPGTRGYEYVKESIEYVKGKIFMEE